MLICVDEGCDVGIGHAEGVGDAAQGCGCAGGLSVLDQRDVHGGVVVLQENVVGVVDEDLGAVFLDAVVRDAAEGVAEIEALAVVGDEDDEDEDEEEDDDYDEDEEEDEEDEEDGEYEDDEEEEDEEEDDLDEDEDDKDEDDEEDDLKLI